MGYDQASDLGSALRAHYEKFLYPFDVFESSKDKLDQVQVSTYSHLISHSHTLAVQCN